MGPRERAAEIARMLAGLDEASVRAYARTLVPATEDRCRDVRFVDEALVLKLPAEPSIRITGLDGHAIRPEYGHGQNEAEAALWRQLPAELRVFFAEVYESGPGGLWLLQERVLPYMAHQTPPPELYEATQQAGVSDLSYKNCGVRRNGVTEQPVVFDYGISHMWRAITGRTSLDLVPATEWTITTLPAA